MWGLFHPCPLNSASHFSNSKFPNFWSSLRVFSFGGCKKSPHEKVESMRYFILQAYNVQSFGIFMVQFIIFGIEFLQFGKNTTHPRKKNPNRSIFFPPKICPWLKTVLGCKKRWKRVLCSPKNMGSFSTVLITRHGRQWGSSYRDSDSEDGNDGDELSEVGWDGFSWNSGNQIGIWALGKSIMTSVAGWSPQILLKK